MSSINNRSGKTETLFNETGGCCVYCGEIKKERTLDHIIPRSKGGGASIANLLPACGPCNNAKNAYDNVTDLAHPKFRKYVERKEAAARIFKLQNELNWYKREGEMETKCREGIQRQIQALQKVVEVL